MVTMTAPCLRAWCISAHRCVLVTLVFEPQLMMYRARTMVSGSITARVPSVTAQPAAPAVAQMVRSSSDAPRRWKNRRSRLLPCNCPIVMGWIKKYGREGRSALGTQPSGSPAPGQPSGNGHQQVLIRGVKCPRLIAIRVNLSDNLAGFANQHHDLGARLRRAGEVVAEPVNVR